MLAQFFRYGAAGAGAGAGITYSRSWDVPKHEVSTQFESYALYYGFESSVMDVLKFPMQKVQTPFERFAFYYGFESSVMDVLTCGGD